MEGEEVCFFFVLFFLLIWIDISLLPTYPQVDQNHVVHLKNLFGELD